MLSHYATTIEGGLSLSGQIASSLATGTAPLSVASTTMVANLNVEKLAGLDWVNNSVGGSPVLKATGNTFGIGGLYWNGSAWSQVSDSGKYSFAFRHGDAAGVAVGAGGRLEIMFAQSASTGAGSAAGAITWFVFDKNGSLSLASAATGTAPLIVSSTTLVNNLNVQYLNGLQSGDYSRLGSWSHHTAGFGGQYELYLDAYARNDATYGTGSIYMWYRTPPATLRQFILTAKDGYGLAGSTLGSLILTLPATGTEYVATTTFTAATYLPLTGGTLSSALTINYANPRIAWYASGAALNEKRWDIAVNNTSMYGIAYSDDTLTSNAWLSVVRSGITISSISLAATTLTFNGQTIWHAGNDGSTSGLDSDLLDAQHGSYYLNTSSGSQIKLGDLTVGDAASGQSIFTVTSQQPCFRLVETDQAVDYKGWQIAASIGGLYLSATDDAFTASTVFMSVSRTGLTASAIAFAATAVTINGGTVWHSGNDGASSSLDAGLLGGSSLNKITAGLRANHCVRGGGTLTVSATLDVKWDQRMVCISNGRGTHFATSGYYDIGPTPTSGTITGVGGAANATATAAGIPMAIWQSLYYILPIGSTFTFLPANLRIVSYTTDVVVPEDWVLLAHRNGENGIIYFANGIYLRASQSYNTALSSSAGFGQQIAFSVATGTAPFTVASTTLVSNLNAERFNSQVGSYYLDTSSTNQTKTGTLTIAGMTLSHTTPNLTLYESDSPVDYKFWSFVAAGNILYGRVYNDAYAAPADWLSVTRTAAAITTVTLAGVSIQLNGNVVGSAALTSTGTSAGLWFYIRDAAPARWAWYSQTADALLYYHNGTTGANVFTFTQAGALSSTAGTFALQSWCNTNFSGAGHTHVYSSLTGVSANTLIGRTTAGTGTSEQVTVSASGNMSVALTAGVLSWSITDTPTFTGVTTSSISGPSSLITTTSALRFMYGAAIAGQLSSGSATSFRIDTGEGGSIEMYPGSTGYVMISGMGIIGPNDGTRLLGASWCRWSNTYSVLGNFSGLITASAGIDVSTYCKLPTSTTGAVAACIEWDSANNRIRVYNGSTWKYVNLV